MQQLTDQIIKMQQVLDAPYREREAVFASTFDTPMTLIIVRYGSRATHSVVALCNEEIAPLKTKFYEPLSLYHSPISMSDVQIETRPVTIQELCHSSDERDPRNGNAQEDLGKNPILDLMGRFLHLKGKDVSGAESWGWLGHKPYPIIEDKLHFLAQKYEFSNSKDDEWFELPLRGRHDFIQYYTCLDFTPPVRLALTMPDGFMRAFDMADGFVGPEDFVWLRALPTSVRARASFEGIRADDLKNMPRNLKEANAGWPPGTERFDRGDEPPRITGTHAYGPGWKRGSLIRLTQAGMSLVPRSPTAVKDADHMIALIARDGNTLEGPWRISEDGAHWKGPSLDKVQGPWWGFAVRLGHDGREHRVEHWRAVLRSTCDFAGPEFLEAPQLGAQLKSLIAPVRGENGIGKLWGAICPETGREIIPFTFKTYHERMYGDDCMIFTDADNRHHVFDENGNRVLGPLKTFEMVEGHRAQKYAAHTLGKSDDERLHLYLRQDLPFMFKRAKSRARFGDLDRYAPTLAAYSGRLKEGRKDAELAGLWHANVEIVRDGEVYGTMLRKGMKGRVSFGDVAQFGGSSMFGWEQELPVTGLFPDSSGRVIGVPFDMLRIPKRSKLETIRRKLHAPGAKTDWIERLFIARWSVWSVAGLSLVLRLFWEGLPLREIWIAAVLIFALFWAVEAYLKRSTQPKPARKSKRSGYDPIRTEILFEQVDELDEGKETERVKLYEYADGRVTIHRDSYGVATRRVTGYFENEAFIYLDPENAKKLTLQKIKTYFASGWIPGRDALQKIEREGQVTFNITVLGGSD